MEVFFFSESRVLDRKKPCSTDSNHLLQTLDILQTTELRKGVKFSLVFPFFTFEIDKELERDDGESFLVSTVLTKSGSALNSRTI